jgi:Zn-dependent peptidase ImmA (M78 family)
MGARQAVGGMVGKRLQSARKSSGLSTRRVSELLKRQVPMSHSTIANIERGETTPTGEMLSAFAQLYERPLSWILGDSPTLSGIRYRNLRSRVGVGDRARFEGVCQRWLDAYVKIERWLREPSCRTERKLPPTQDDVASYALQLRREVLDLDDGQRLDSVIDVLEMLGCRVLEVKTDLAIDGLSARYGEEHVVVLTTNVSNDRARMNAAHELAHVVLGDCDSPIGEESPAVEKRAFALASRLLITREMVAEAVRRKSLVDLVKYKERFGVSMAAIVYRAGEEGFMTPDQTRRVWIEFSRRGWRSREPGRVWCDRPIRMEAIVDAALVAGKATVEQVADKVGVRVDELKERLAYAAGVVGFDKEVQRRDAGQLRLVR